jgi:general secretion pathway protein D
MKRWGRCVGRRLVKRSALRAVRIKFQIVLPRKTRNPMKPMKLQKTLVVLLGGALSLTGTLGLAQQPRAGGFPAQPTNGRTYNTSPQANSGRASGASQSNQGIVAQAGTDAPILRTLRLPPERLVDVADSLGLKYGYGPNVNVTFDKTNSSLIILAPPTLQASMDNDVQTLLGASVIQKAGRTISTAVVSRQFPLKGITWREFEDTLQTLAGGRLPSTTRRNGELASFELVDQPVGNATVEVDRRANAVTIVAPEPSLVGWETLIQSLDSQAVPAGQVLELAKIRNAEPAPIQRAIRLLRQLKPSDAPGTGSAIGVAGNDVRFMGTALAQDGIQGGNQNGTLPEDEQPEEEMPEEAGLFGDVQIQFVPELGVIVVRGAKRDVQRVMSVIDEIEKAAVETQPIIEVVELKHIDSQATATLVTQLYTDVLNTRGASLSVTGLVKPNALLLIGRAEAVQGANDLIAKLDQPVDAGTQLRVFRLQHSSAIDAETTVRNFFSDRPGVSDQDLRPVLGTRLRIISDYRTNSLIVQAAPRDLAEVAKLVRDLDIERVPAQDEIRVFPLSNALADDLQPVLQEAITGQADGTNTPDQFTRPSTSLAILAVESDTNRLIESGVLAGVLVRADANANALVVRAPSSSMPLIAELIRQLDQLPGAETVVKVFQLNNSDATALSQALTTLFSSQTQGGGGQGGANLSLAPLSSSTESSLVPLRFSTDIRTNSVIAVGSISDLEVVESIVLRLDTEGFASRITEVVWLRNATASIVANAITSYVSARLQGINGIQQVQQGGLGVYDLTDRDLIVVAEDVSNSLLLSVSPRLYDTIRRVIDQLDRRPPMIMVKVVLAEVRLGDGFEWGSEFGIQDSLLFDRGAAGAGSVPGFNFNANGTPNVSAAGRGTVASQAISSFGLTRASEQFGYGGFVLSAASDSVSLLLRSLQDADRLQVLSRPMIMTRDNTEAVVQVGQTVPRVNGTTTVGLNVQLNVADVEVGLILRVTPRVGSDGLIRMDIDAERSAIGDLADGTPVGFDNNGNPIISPPIDVTRAQSTLHAFSGQTVVYGGLIQKSRTQFSRRVPYISNIPVLGHLFRFDQEIETRSELLVIMTPMVINGDEDLEYVKQTESSRMSYCLADVVEMHGDVGLNGGYGLWGPAVGPMIYPDMTPTIDDIEMIHSQELGLPQPLESGTMQGNYGEYPGAYEQAVPNSVPTPQFESGVPMEPGLVNPAMPGVVEPAYPVTPTGHVRQVIHSAPASRSTQGQSTRSTQGQSTRSTQGQSTRSTQGQSTRTPRP